jgi:hypothetical protein
MEDFTMIAGSATFKNFIRTTTTDMNLLGAPILKGRAQDIALKQKNDDLERAISRLLLLQAHDALDLLKNSLGMPKL